MVYLESTSGMDAIVSGISTVTSVVSQVFSAITSNPLLVFFLSVSVLGAGIGVFMRLKNAAH